MIRQPAHIRNRVLGITLFAILIGLLVPKVWMQENIAFFAAFLIIGGIPHGAADHLMFKVLNEQNKANTNWYKFSLLYLLVMLIYGFVWWWQPLLAFLLFMIISIYHFGQSNWVHVSFTNAYWSVLTYLLWGGLVVSLPVLIYHEQSSLIISEITRINIDMTSYRWPLLFLLSMANVLNIIYLFDVGTLNAEEFRKELLHLGLLTGLFLCTPMLIGFGIYFVFWHALGTINDQFQTLKELNQHYNFKSYLLKLMPLSLIALLGLLVAYWLIGEQMNRGANFGLLFLFISVITVPHSIIMDRFYLMDMTSSKKH